MSARLSSAYHRLFAASTISNLGDGIGTIAYPWLASAITRDPLLVALVVVVQRLPWLLLTIPAGVITDRYDRRLLLISTNSLRAVLTGGVALMVAWRGGLLPGPDAVAAGESAAEFDLALYLVVLLATFLLGSAEVLYDNTAQTFLPSVVEEPALEKANGRLWAAELVANTLVGPVLGAALLVISFSVPFAVDAATFGLSAALIATIASRSVRRPSSPAAAPDGSAAERPSWRAELLTGVRWLWAHPLLRPLAVILGALNLLGTMTTSALVLYGQEVLDTSPTEFAILGTGGALGGVLGGWLSPMVSRRLGPGPSLWLTLVAGGITNIVVGLTSWWPLAWAMFAVFMFVAVLWNVITVSLRQAIIPDELLGRVNSVYRFFAWGAMPLGALAGGVLIAGADLMVDRELALRVPWLVGGVLQIVLLVPAAPRLTTARIEAARADAEAEGENTTG
ncbi:MAG: MFS transporter [Actinomycetota bacterium]